MIPKAIKREHVLQAIDEIRKDGVPKGRASTKYNLLHEDVLYPPKYVLSIAGKYSLGEQTDHKKFSGGDEANGFLEHLGFKIVTKGDWTDAECYFAVWAYDRLDIDRTIMKSGLYAEIADLIGRSLKAVEFKIQNVSYFDPRPRDEKPISEAANAQKLLGKTFEWYWQDRERARELHPDYLQQIFFGQDGHAREDDESGGQRPVIIEEGAEGHSNSKTRKRSARLLSEGRKYFKSRDKDGQLRCHACGYTKPRSVDREIVQLHHTEMISDVDSNGRELNLDEAIQLLIPLCPNCHQLAHISRPPQSLPQIKQLLGL